VQDSVIYCCCYLRVQIFCNVSASLFRWKESKKFVECMFLFLDPYWKKILYSRNMQFGMINLLFSCVTVYILFSFLILNRILGVNCRERNSYVGEEFLHVFTFSLLSIHGELTKMEGEATLCSNSRMKDDRWNCIRRAIEQKTYGSVPNSESYYNFQEFFSFSFPLSQAIIFHHRRPL
jgi:hypothetical protein